MVSSRHASRALPGVLAGLRTRTLAALLVLVVVGALAPRLEAGADDFEFGQKLAQNRFFTLARKVYATMLESPRSSEPEKDLARFGLATLGYQEALTASVRPEETFADVLKLFDTAADQIDEFAKKNPNHPKAKEARLLSGEVRLQVVLWCRDLLEKPEILAARKTTAGEVAAAARGSIDAAVAHFEALRTVEGDLGELADYNWTKCQFYRALTLDPGSPPQIEALKAAEGSLEQYVTDHDGQILAVFAADDLGQALAERAKHATNPEERIQLLTKALTWFQTCIDQENVDSGTLTVITNGYQHYAQTCLEAGRIGTRNFLREGVDVLAQMLERVPTAARTRGGLKALLYYGDLEKGLGNNDSAVRIYKDASERAKQAGFSTLENEANSRLKGIISSSAGGTAGVTDVNVLRKVADSLFLEKRYEEAIRTFQSVIAGAPATAAGFVDFVWPAWERIAASYKELGDPLSAAMAYEAVHEAWMDGRIPHKNGDENDANMRRAGSDRKRGAALLDELAARTGSKVMREASKRADSGFATDYPDHPDAKNSELRLAIEKIKAAREAKRAKQPTWRGLYEEARTIFVAQAKNLQSENQDTAYAQIIVIDVALSDATPEGQQAAERGLRTSQEALDFWASAPAKQKLAEYPALAARRQEAQVVVRSERGELHKRLSRWDDVLKEMATLWAEQGKNQRGYDALALIVEAHLTKGDVKAADAALLDLLQSNHLAIPALIGKLANRFDEAFRELTKQFNKANEELNGTKEDRSKGVVARLRAAEQRYNDVIALRVNVTAKIDEYVRQIAAWRKDPLLVPGMTAKTVKELEEVTLPALKKEVVKLDAELPVVEKLIKELAQRSEELTQEILRVTTAQYEPLIEAVKRYDLGLESQLVNAPATVKADDIQRVAARWYAAARNAKGTDTDWERARKRYEQFLDHADTRALPDADAGKRGAVTKLGRVYSYFSAREEDPVKRAELVRQAVLMLETSLASRPENTELVLGLLSGRYGAIVWENPLDMGPLHRFILPKTQDAAALRAAIAKLGGPDSTLGFLKLADEGKQVGYRKALTAWKDALAKLTPEAFEALFKNVQGSGLDAATYRELGNTGLEFRTSLAAAYAEGGEDAELNKGDVILATLLKGPISVEPFGDDYWEIATLVLRHWLNHAERLSASGGVPARASEVRKRAKQFIMSQTSVASVPLKDGVRDAWKKLLERLNKGLRGEGAPEVLLDFDKQHVVAPPGVPAAPAAPAAPAPASPDPAAPKEPAPGGAPPGGGK